MMCPLDGIQVNSLFEHLPQWAHVAQFIDGVGHLLDRVIDLLFGGIAAQPEAKRRVCQVITQTKRF